MAVFCYFPSLLCCACLLLLPGREAGAEEIVLRFEAIRRSVNGSAPPGSVTARAAELATLSGTFGFSTGAALVADAGIPERITFASYATGFITVNEIDTSGLPGSLNLRVGDGFTQVENPETTIKDDLILSYTHESLDQPIDSLSLRLTYKDADTLSDVSIPPTLDQSDFESASLVFSNRTDRRSTGAARRRQSAGVSVRTPGGQADVPSLVIFELRRFERTD